MHPYKPTRIVLTTIVAVFLSSRFAPGAAAAGFELVPVADSALLIVQDGRPVAKYMHGHDLSTEDRHHDTYKPYLHVLDVDGITPITKGAGGEFTHHRGIFIGWNRILFNGSRFDRWHMKGGDMVHQEFTRRDTGPGHAAFTARIHWNDGEEKPILVEHRTLTFRPGGEAGRLIIDFESTLKAVRGEVVLDGDPEHAGIQFRPANEVDRSATVYVFPRPSADPKKDLDYPWVGETFSLHNRRHSVVHMNHPSNPKDTRYSAYRDYGRFGAFFVTTVPAGESLTVRYRFLIASGELPSVPAIQSVWDAFADMPSPSPLPEITVVHQKGESN